MEEIVLPLDRFSAEKYISALENLVNRYESDKEPVHYKKAAIGMSDTTCSSCLRYFNDIGLIDAEKAGVYVPNKPTANYFRKVGAAQKEALQKIKGELENDKLFSEILFLTDTESMKKSDLSTEVAGQLGVDKDNLDRVDKAIEVFIELGLLDVSSKGIVQEVVLNSESQNQLFEYEEESEISDFEDTGDEDEEKEVSLSFDDNNQSDDFPSDLIDNFEIPPYRTSPEKLIEVCQELSMGGEWTDEKIIEETDLAGNTARNTISYGIELGLIKEDDGKIELTPSGFDLGYEEELSDTTEDFFRQGISESKIYSALVLRLYNQYFEKLLSKQELERDSVLREIRVWFGLTGPSQDVLQRATATFFETLEAAGCGEYIVGRGSKPTRLELDSDGLEVFENLAKEVISQRTLSVEPVQSELEVSSSVQSGGTVGNDVGTGTETDTADRTGKETDAVDFGDERSDSADTSSTQRGPPLRISYIRIQNYRNLKDTGQIPLENICTLIGQNESGKTSTLEAINSFDTDSEYESRVLCNDVDIVDKSETPIITLGFKISRGIAKEFYPEIIESEEVDLPIEVELTKFADGSKKQTSISAPLQDHDIQLPSPDILYYKEYDVISDQVYLDKLAKNDEGYRTFRSLLDVGELEPEILLEKNGLERDSAISRAEDKIEAKLNSVWSQKDIEISLRFDESDKALRLYLQDTVEKGDRGLTQPSQRSEGFRWFFSFYVNLIAETKGGGDGHKILLLDDPAVHLHPAGKRDWLHTVEEIGKEEQVIYSSHSPYLIQKRYPSRIRTVEDHDMAGTKIGTDVFDAEQGTLEPLRNALGVNLGSSPFISQRQVLVEGPSEYYILSAVANYFEDVLDRQIFDWGEIAIMPVRGAPDVIGKASWLASEDIEYAVLLDSDGQGRDISDRIANHHRDIDDDRVILLEKGSHLENIVLEDMFPPDFYVPFVNDEYSEFTSELDATFEPIEVKESDSGEVLINDTPYDGTRLDLVLESALSDQEVSNHLEDSSGKITLRKRQIAERIANHVNNNIVDESLFEHFNPLFAKLNSATDLKK